MAGLILVVIVGAWLAVLVPMAVHRHDSAASLKSADKFGDAMKVLSRRTTRDVVVPRRPADSMVISETRSPRPVAPSGPTGRQLAAQRRRRSLAVLAAVSWLTLVLAVVGVAGALYVHVLSDLLLVGFVVHLRKQAVLRAQRKAAEQRRQQRVPAPRRSLSVEGIPARMPSRPAPLTAPLPIPAARYEDKPAVPVPAPAATVGAGAPWSPVPVPPPTYVGKATAPKRPPRVLDLTKPGEWTAALEGDDHEIDLTDGSELDEILDRRRAVNDW